MPPISLFFFLPPLLSAVASSSSTSPPHLLSARAHMQLYIDSFLLARSVIVKTILIKGICALSPSARHSVVVVVVVVVL